MFVEHVNHHVDAKREAIVKHEHVRVEFFFAAPACFQGNENYRPPHHMEHGKDAYDLIPQSRLLTLYVAKKNMEHNKAEVVGHGLKSR